MAIRGDKYFIKYRESFTVKDVAIVLFAKGMISKIDNKFYFDLACMKFLEQSRDFVNFDDIRYFSTMTEVIRILRSKGTSLLPP
jgi:hypothetical protein